MWQYMINQLLFANISNINFIPATKQFGVCYRESDDEVLGFVSAKYTPVTPASFGLTAQLMDVAAPCSVALVISGKSKAPSIIILLTITYTWYR